MLKFFKKHDPSVSDWQCYKCNGIFPSRSECTKCHRKFNRDKDQEIKSENTSPSDGNKPKLKPIKKYRKNQTDENDPSRGANSDDTQGVTDTAHSVVGRQGSSEPNTGNQNDGWICKICYMSGNQEKQCKMCKQEKKDSHDEENIKNRRKRKNINRSKLHAGESIRVDKERKRQKMIAEDIANNIKDYCQKNKIHYEDKCFPDPNDPSYDRKEWRRIKDVQDKSCKGSKPWTILSNPSPDDAIQGSAENCWFLCSVSLLAQKKNLLDDIIVTKNFSEEGLYQVRLCKDGNWKTVIVDDRFPCDRNGNLKYSRPQNKQLWVMLLEKAAAKLHGGYQALNAGLVVESLAMLTGEPCEHIDITGSDFEKKDDKKCQVDSEKLWENLKSWNQSRYLLGISTPKDNDHEELEDSHCYPILAVEDTRDGKKLLKLWTSSDHQHCVTGCLRSNLSLQKERKRLLRDLRKGEFWISFEEEFLRYFNYLSVCKVEEGWYESRFKGVFPPVLNDEWKYYSFRLVNDTITKLKLGLFQKSMRGLGVQMESFSDLLILVLQNQEDKLGHPFKTEPLFSRVLSYSKRRARSLTMCSVDLSPGSYTLACFSFGKLQQDDVDFMEDDYVSYTLSIHSSQPLFIDEVNATKFEQLRYAPADALITLAKQSKMDSRETSIRISQINGNVYCAMFMFYGEICVFINEASEGYVYNRNYGKSSYLMAVRRSLSTSDYIPAKSGRVINIVTPINPETPWEVVAQKGFEPCHDSRASTPAIPDTLKALLTARPIPEIMSA